jgi:IMP dehydrogenase/GMP reductase
VGDPAADRRRAREHGLHRLRAPSRRCARAQFVEITSAGMRESHVHDVQITKEAPNYRVE